MAPPATIVPHADTTASGATAQLTSASAVTPRTARSNRLSGRGGLTSGRFFASQFHQGDEHQQRGDADPISEFGRIGNAERVQVHQKIADEQQRQGCEHRQITPVFSCDDLASDSPEKRGREGKVGHRRSVTADQARQQDACASRHPKRNEHGQGPALQRHSAGPIRNCRQQKTGNGRRGEAEDHFMNVPNQRREQARQCRAVAVDGQPQRNSDGRPDRRSKEEGAEPGGEKDGARMRAIAGNGGHGLTSLLRFDRRPLRSVTADVIAPRHRVDEFFGVASLGQSPSSRR